MLKQSFMLKLSSKPLTIFRRVSAIKDEGGDIDEVMARADADLANIGNDGVANSCDDSSPSDDEKIISSEESDWED